MKRRQTISRIGVLLFGALCLSLSVFGSDAQAFNFRVAYPPAFRIAAPPVSVVIPGTYVYVVPDIDVDIFFFHGFWYRPHGGQWFRASSYNGPWNHIASNRVPGEMLHLPPHDYRRIPPGHSRIPYGHLKKDWRKWERDRHWERDNTWRGGWRNDDRRDDRRDNRPNDGRPDRKDWNDGRGDQRHDDRDRDGRDRRPGESGPPGPDRGQDRGRDGRGDRPHGR